ncbi:MAG: amino acid adenylation domain-containing protein [Chloroflexi bacterium]|nr:amino acid adenylation domain-containing protein [Chloroflexota bacterium]
MFQSLHADSSAYHMVDAYRARGTIHVDRLQSSLNRLIQRHEILRTTFEWIDGELFQHIAPALEVELSVADLSGKDETAIEAQIARLAALPFDLSAGPLLRLSVLHTGDDEYFLLFVIHHIIADEHANRLFWSELAALYATPEALDDEAPQYVDFAEAQNRPDATMLAAQTAYWEQLLAGTPPQHGLTLDHPRPSTQTYRGRLHALDLASDLSQRLRACAQENQVSLAMLLHAAYALLLHRYSGHDSILIGAPVSQRDQPQFERMLGFFLNTVAIRADIDGGSTFRNLLAHVRERVLGALAHGDLPFDRLVEGLKVSRDASIHPLFQVMFVYREAQALPALPGITLARYPIDQGVAKFDITLFAADEGEHIALQIEYNTDLFDARTVARLLEHLRNLLDSVTARPDAPLRECAYLSPAEEHQLLYGWNATDVDDGQKGLIADLIRVQAAATPDAPALLLRGESLSYPQLDSRAGALAQHLLAQGAIPGEPVALCFERSFEMFIAMLACLRLGSPYVPIDPAYPAERVAAMLEDSTARRVLTQQHLTGRLAERAGDRIVVTVDTLPLDSPSSTQPLPAVAGDTPAYILYTSGSTGRPKGVVITHGNLTHSTLARHIYYPERVDRYLLLSPYVFDSSVAGIYWTLTQGGALVLPEPGSERDADHLVGLVKRHRVTHTLCLPSLYAIMLESADRGQLDSLRTVIVAGEACPASLIDAHYAARPQAALINEYGPTEGTVWATAHRITAEDAGKNIPIGRPIANMQAYIVDRYLQPLPAGVPGELVIAGKGLADRYLNQPELTADRFLHFPLTNRRIYRTGDLARWRADGVDDSVIEFLGRIDHQVKIRGHRIELGEIENTLLRHHQVEAAVVLSVTAAQSAGLELAAFVVPRPDAAPSAGALREFLLEHLPDYMIPARIHRLDALPQTFNGKVDRAALIRLDAEQAPEQERVVIPPRTPTEAAIAAIWSDLLDVEVVSIDDDFFDLGGHSLLAMRVISQINRRLKSKLSVPDLLQYPTVEALARQADPESARLIANAADATTGEKPSSHSPHVVPIQTTGRHPIFWGVTRAQLGVFAYHDLSKRMGPDYPIYALRTPGLDGEMAPFDDIPALASYYLLQIRKIQATGPYVLGGYSVAGLIAFEMAQQLVAAGEDVALLVLFDTAYYDESTNIVLSSQRRALRRRLLRRILSIPRYVFRYLTLSGEARKTWLEARRSAVPDLSPEALRERAVKQAQERASQKYVIQPFSQPILFFSARAGRNEQDTGLPMTREEAWSQVAQGGLTLIDVPGDHQILGGPHAQAVAERLARAINAAHAPSE